MKWEGQTIVVLCAVVMGFLGLGAMMQTGFGAINDRMTSVESRQDARLDALDARLDDLSMRMAGVEAQLADLNRRMYRVESLLFGVEPVEAVEIEPKHAEAIISIQRRQPAHGTAPGM